MERKCAGAGRLTRRGVAQRVAGRELLAGGGSKDTWVLREVTENIAYENSRGWAVDAHVI